MDSYFKFAKSPAVEGTKFFAYNMFISGGRREVMVQSFGDRSESSISKQINKYIP